ncbi:MAG: hypothetical protein MR423_02825 [Firmicutes bacterium]|nr:hypothetical protein [Bacillota bacterium]MDY3658978.1 hypothetical protein [Eubacteriales bacterium]
MLDKRCEELLRIVNKECQEGSYKVLEVDDLIRLMPKKFKVDYETINQLMGYLKAGEYVSVKYSDKEVFCVSPLPRGRRIFEVEIEEKRNKKKSKFKSFLLLTFYLLLIFGVSLGASYVSRII